MVIIDFNQIFIDSRIDLAVSWLAVSWLAVSWLAVSWLAVNWFGAV